MNNVFANPPTGMRAKLPHAAIATAIASLFAAIPAHAADAPNAKAAPAAFDVDVYRILVRYLAKNRTIDWHHLREPCAS